MSLSMKQKQNHRPTEQIVVSKGKGGWGVNGLGVGDNRYKLLHIEWVKNRSYYIAQRTIFNIL